MKKYLLYGLMIIIGIAVGKYAFNGSPSSDDTHEHAQEDKKSAVVWTCSMHPQIKQPKKGLCPICAMDLIEADDTGGNLDPESIKMTAHAMELASIETLKINHRSPYKQQELLEGTVRIDGNLEKVQSAYFAGRIETLYIDAEGQKISKGQLIATLYAPAVITAQKELLIALKNKEERPRIYEAIVNKFKLWNIADDFVNKLIATKKIMEYIPVHALYSGVVTQKHLKIGDYVKMGSKLFSSADLSRLWIDFNAYEHHLGWFKKGNKLMVAIGAKQLEAKVIFIDPLLDSKNRTFKVRAVVKNKNNALKPGMFANAMINVNQGDSEVIYVPKSAVLWTGKRSIVYVKNPKEKGVFKLREVVLGAMQGGDYQVTEGLESGEEIVVQGAFTVDAAAQLAGKNTMMSRDSEQQVKLTPNFQRKLIKFIDKYLVLQRYLAADNGEKAKLIGIDLKTVLKSFTISEQLENKDWKTLMQKSKEIAQTADLSAQRTAFKILSERLIELAKATELPYQLHLQHCPMASDGKGAFWLSKTKEIRNPYFGASMLKCGSTEGIL